MRIKKVAILGSTGSIGINTLKVIDEHPDRFKVIGLSAFSNERLFNAQVSRYKPRYKALGPDGAFACEAMACAKDVDIVVLAIRGAAALAPFLAAARAGKIIAPANKEALVIAGHVIMPLAQKYKAVIIPVDSEQSAIFQCLDGQRAPLKKVHLTASGGPLRNVAVKHFDRMTVKDILKHPRWSMGPKITVDSATLMNKGFEFIEAQRLFDLQHDQINVLVHPEAIIHSMVEFADGSIIAQLGVTDMRLPIQYALTYPQRLPTGLKVLDLSELGQLNFSKPDFKKFPALGLALQVAKTGGSAPCVLNAANEEAVDAFLQGKIRFTAIYHVVEKVLTRHKIIQQPSLDDVFSIDQWARAQAQAIIARI